MAFIALKHEDTKFIDAVKDCQQPAFAGLIDFEVLGPLTFLQKVIPHKFCIDGSKIGCIEGLFGSTQTDPDTT